jgi:hypothetical protein
VYLMGKAQALFAATGRDNGVTVFDNLTGFRVIINDQNRGTRFGRAQGFQLSLGQCRCCLSRRVLRF